MLDFSTAGETDEPTHQSLGAGIIQLLPPSEIRQQYSDYFARQIRADGMAEIASRFRPSARVQDLRTYVELRLTGACASCAERKSGLAPATTAEQGPPDNVELTNDESGNSQPPEDGQAPKIAGVYRRTYARRSDRRRSRV